MFTGDARAKPALCDKNRTGVSNGDSRFFYPYSGFFKEVCLTLFSLMRSGKLSPGVRKGLFLTDDRILYGGWGESSKTGGILCKGRIFVCRPCRILPAGKGIFQGGTELSEKYFCLLRCQGDPEFHPTLSGGYPVDIEQTCIECCFPGGVGVELGKV